jgi:hypothetical protein
MKMYHVTTLENAEKILEEGLKIGKVGGFTVGGEWADDIYGVRPVYLSASPLSFDPLPDDQVRLEVDVGGLDLAADLPHLVDYGAYVDDRGLWWEDKYLPLRFRKLLGQGFDRDGEFEYTFFLEPGPVVEAAIKVTGTAAVLEDIPSRRIELYNI